MFVAWSNNKTIPLFVAMYRVWSDCFSHQLCCVQYILYGSVRRICIQKTITNCLFFLSWSWLMCILQAQEASEAKRSTTAKLTITVKPVDSNPPEIQASAPEGFVNENAPIGTEVVDSEGKSLVLVVTDKDLVRQTIFSWTFYTHEIILN